MAEELEASIDVSVIVAVRNGAKTLAQCIDSIVGQVMCKVELIIVDALSDDGTQEIVEAYGSNIATYIREHDRGIYDAWNKAITFARGEWCAFLGSDDSYIFETSLHELLILVQETATKPALAYGGTIRVGPHRPYIIHPNPSSPRDYVLSGRGVPIPSAIFQRAILQDISGFKPEYKILGDLDALMRICQHGTIVRHPKHLAKMQTGGISDQWKNQRVRNQERFKILAEHIGHTEATWRNLKQKMLEYLGWFFERLMYLLMGKRRGEMVVVWTRTAMGQAPRVRHF